MFCIEGVMHAPRLGCRRMMMMMMMDARFHVTLVPLTKKKITFVLKHI